MSQSRGLFAVLPVDFSVWAWNGRLDHIFAIDLEDFYRDMFEQQVKKADMRAVFTEYAWDMNWCDPCAADPLSVEELQSLGVFWLSEAPPDLIPGRGRRPIMPPMGGARDVFVTRSRAPGAAGREQKFPTIKPAAA